MGIFHEILVVAGCDDVASAKISFVDPIFVVEDMIFATATKAAIENVITSLQRQPHAFADDQCARAQLFSEHPEAANLRLWRDSPDDPGDGGAMAENVLGSALHSCQPQPRSEHGLRTPICSVASPLADPSPPIASCTE